jgi:hypothetical protein
MTTLPTPTTATPFACPRCAAAAQPSPEIQCCSQCAGRFVLRAGPLADPRIQPVYDPTARRITVRWAATFTVRMGMLEPVGVAEGMADPITGLIPLDQNGIMFPDVYSVTIWRKPEVVRFVLASILILPFALGAAWASLSTPGFLVFALPLLLLEALLAYRAFGVQAQWARVVGRYRTVEVRFDRPFWRRRAFHDELMRRSGIGPSPIP